MILKADDSGLYVLNEIGTILWQAADGATPLSTIVDRMICPKFEIDAAAALCDATEFVRALADRNILQVSDRPLAGAEPVAARNEAVS